MTAVVNGEERHLPEQATISHLLEQAGISATRVAVELNREILPKAAYGETVISEGDRIEIVHFVGGG